MKRQKRTKKLNNANCLGNGGFSLVEVIISIAILALITIPLLNYFTDSLRRSASMAKQQNATLLAQELTEAMKAADSLIEETAPGTYSVVNLPDGLTVIDINRDGFDDSTGRGEFIVRAETADFDVDITLSTDSYVNGETRSLVYGIDASTDVVILERDQQTEAMAYYTAANSEYCAATGQTPKTQNEIQDNLTRKIYITVTKNASDYTVQAYYEYECANLRGTDPSDPQNAPIKYNSTYLVDTKVTELKKIYLLYDCVEFSADVTDGGIKDDTIVITMPDNITDPGLSLGLYMVAQNLTKAASGQVYNMRISGFSNPNVSFHSNFDDFNQISNSINVNSTDLNSSEKLPLTDEGKPLRVLEIRTEILESGHTHTAGEDSLAYMQSTKGE